MGVVVQPTRQREKFFLDRAAHFLQLTWLDLLDGSEGFQVGFLCRAIGRFVEYLECRHLLIAAGRPGWLAGLGTARLLGGWRLLRFGRSLLIANEWLEIELHRLHPGL